MEMKMVDHENDKAECPFSGQGETLVNLKFFRGDRNDVIEGVEIKEQFRSAVMQHRQKTAKVSKMAPVSAHQPIDVREFVAGL